MRVALLAVLAACGGTGSDPVSGNLIVHLLPGPVVSGASVVVIDSTGTQTQMVDVPGTLGFDIAGEASVTVIVPNPLNPVLDSTLGAQPGDELTLLEDTESPMLGTFTLEVPPDPGTQGFRILSPCMHEGLTITLLRNCYRARMDLVVMSTGAHAAGVHYIDAPDVELKPGGTLKLQGPWKNLVTFQDSATNAGTPLPDAAALRTVPAGYGESNGTTSPTAEVEVSERANGVGSDLHIHREVFDGEQLSRTVDVSPRLASWGSLAFDPSARRLTARLSGDHNADVLYARVSIHAANGKTVSWQLRAPPPTSDDVSITLPAIGDEWMPMSCNGQCTFEAGLYSSTDIDGFADLRQAPQRLRPILNAWRPLAVGTVIRTSQLEGMY